MTPVVNPSLPPKNPNFFAISRKKCLKVFRLMAAILGLKFVNLVMFNCSLLSKTCLNVYRPTSPILSLPGSSCGAPAAPQAVSPW